MGYWAVQWPQGVPWGPRYAFKVQKWALTANRFLGTKYPGFGISDGALSDILLDATPYFSWVQFRCRLLAFTDALSLPVNHNTQLPAEPLFLSHPAGR